MFRSASKRNDDDKKERRRMQQLMDQATDCVLPSAEAVFLTLDHDDSWHMAVDDRRTTTGCWKPCSNWPQQQEQLLQDQEAALIRQLRHEPDWEALLQQTGSVWGQQEYQFASFETSKEDTHTRTDEDDELQQQPPRANDADKLHPKNVHDEEEEKKETMPTEANNNFVSFPEQEESWKPEEEDEEEDTNESDEPSGSQTIPTMIEVRSAMSRPPRGPKTTAVTPHQQQERDLTQPYSLQRRQSRHSFSSAASSASMLLASPEGRFVHRRLQYSRSTTVDESIVHRKQESSTSTMDEVWFQDGYPMDYMVKFLQTLDWNQIPVWNQPQGFWDASHKGDSFDLQATVTEHLCELDQWLSNVQHDLVTHLQPHLHQLESANGCIFQLEQALRLSFVYWKRSTTSLELARSSAAQEDNDQDGTGLNGLTFLMDSWEKAREYQELDQILALLQEVCSEQEMIKRQIADFAREWSITVQHKSTDVIVEQAKSLQVQRAALLHRLEEERSLASLNCFDSVREETRRLISHAFSDLLWRTLDSIVIRLCRSTANKQVLENEYCILHKVMKELNVMQDKQTWPDHVRQALMVEIQQAFAVALLEPSALPHSTDNDDDDEQSDNNDNQMNFDSELFVLKAQLELKWQDPKALETIVYNLVTIRFDLLGPPNECMRHVWHKLLKTLCHVLHASECLLLWPGPPLKEGLDSAKRKDLYKACLVQLTTCLSEYAKHSSKQAKLFTRKVDKEVGVVVQDDEWQKDLITLYDMGKMTEHFFSVGWAFLGAELSACCSQDERAILSMLKERYDQHLRSVHVESMNTTGLSLAKETWALQSLGSNDQNNPLAQLRQALSVDVLPNVFAYATHFDESTSIADGNPFDLVLHSNNASDESAASKLEADEPTGFPHENLNKCFQGGRLLVPRTFAQVFLPWISRLRMVLHRLPIVASDGVKAIHDLFDLYMTTVVRLCIGSKPIERLAFCIDENMVGNGGTNENTPAAPPPAVRFGYRRQSSTGSAGSNSKIYRRQRSSIGGSSGSAGLMSSASLARDADLFAPVPEEITNRAEVGRWLVAAQEKLQSVVKLDLIDRWMVDPLASSADAPLEHASKVALVLEKRLVAARNLLALAAVNALFYEWAVRQKISDHSTTSSPEEDPAFYTSMIEKLCWVCIRSASLRAVLTKDVVSEILSLQKVWEANSLPESPNSYIDSLQDFVSMLWFSLCNRSVLPKDWLDECWLDLIESCFLCLLHGFSSLGSRVSTEGRSLMSLDLSALHMASQPASVERHLEEAELFVPQLPPPPSVDRKGLGHVDMFVKVSYFPKEEVMPWIEDNYRCYHQVHMESLALSTFASSRHQQRALQRVRKLYETEEE